MKPIQFAKLSDICRIESGGTPSSSDPSYWDGNIPWVTLVDVRNKYVEATTRRISLSGLKNSSATVLPVGTVLFSSRATIGNVSIAKIELATNQGFKNFICDENKLIPEYLYYFLNYEAKRIEASCPGTTYKEISKSKIGKYTVPLPSLDDQKRIVEILGQSDALRQRRKQSIEFLDDYLKSVFLEMFGDPLRNPNGFEIGKIADLVSEVKYGTSAKATDDGHIPYLRMNNITYSGELDLSDLKHIDLRDDEKEKYLARKGDLLFNRTNSKELVGKSTVYDLDEPMAIAGYLIRVRTNSKALPEYISGYLNSDHGKKTLRHMCKSIVGMANINARELQNIKIMIPPIGLQEQFRTTLERTKRLKQKMLVQSDQLENQFQALMQKAFKGEL